MIPDDWVRCKLGELAKIKTGGTPKRMEPHYWGGDIPWMSSGEIHKRYINDTKEFITEDGLKSSNACLLPQETVMIALNGQGRTRATVAILRTPVTCNQSLAGFITHNNILNANYLFFYLDSKYQSLRDLSGDHGRNGLNLKLLREIEIYLPPLPEQKKIAAILSSVDDAIQATQAVIDQTRRVKQGLMQQLLTRGIGHTRFKQTEIGEIPKEWLEGTFGDYLKEIKGGGTPSRKKPTYWGGTIPWASVKDLNSVYLRNTEEYITQEGLNNSASNLIPAGAVIISTRMALGKVVRFSCDVAINQDLKALFPKKELSSDYLFYWLLLQASLIETLGAGSTVKGIRLETLRALKLMLPPIDEQKKIFAILTGVDEALNIEQDKMLQLHKIKKGLLQDLLTGRVRVKLDGEATT